MLRLQTSDHRWKLSPDCSGYDVEQSGTAFERKAGPKFLRVKLFRFKKYFNE